MSRPVRKDSTRINQYIRVNEVRLIDEKGKQLGVVSTEEALKRAKEVELDLVEVAGDAKPPVCRLMDYSKFRYEKERQTRENKSHQKHTQLKELRFRPRIETHDYETKMKALTKFLKQGHKVKVTLVFRGREMAHQEFGHQLLKRLQADIEPIAQVERPPIQEGRFLFMTLTPK